MRGAPVVLPVEAVAGVEVYVLSPRVSVTVIQFVVLAGWQNGGLPEIVLFNESIGSVPVSSTLTV
jgi:hypothetical protein